MKKTIFAGALAAVMLLSACTRAPEKNNDEAVDLGSGIVLQSLSIWCANQTCI